MSKHNTNCIVPCLVPTLVQDGQHLWLTQDIPDIVGFLTTQKLVPHDDGDGIRIVRQVESLLDRPLNAGLLPVIKPLMTHFAGAAPRYGFTSLRPRPFPKPTVDRIGLLGPVDVDLLDQVQTQAHGLVRYGEAVKPAWLVAQIAFAFPDAAMAVVIENEQAAKSLVAGLLHCGVRATFANAARCPASVSRVVVSTFYGLSHTDLEYEKRDVMVVLDAVQALRQRGTMALQMFTGRLFGFLPVERKISPFEADCLTATFGFHDTVIPKHGYKLRQVATAWHRISGGQRLPNDLLRLKRRGIWNHDIRNRQISAVAKALVADDQAARTDPFPVLAASLSSSEPVNVVILVEGIDHALALAPRLPGWAIVTGPHVLEHGLTSQERQILAERRAITSMGTRAIVTVAGLEQYDLSSVDVLIWAGAGEHVPPLCPTRLTSRHDDDRRLLVIDLDDRYHPLMRRWSRWRRQGYEQAGWFLAGMSQLEGSMRRFLSERPEGTA